MSRTAIIALVCLTAYCLFDLVVSTLVALLWRTRALAPNDLPPSVRARRILLWRIAPAAAALSLTVLIVGPAFALFEPDHHNEEFGPFVAVCAVAAFAQFASAFLRGGRSLWLTRRVEREWLAGSTMLESASPMRAFIIDTPSPVVALIGVFAPKLVAARSVIDACTAEEIAAIVGHERGHFESRDNFKRWAMSMLPDALRHTPIHTEMLQAWHLAAEDAADDAATHGDAATRADLAALVLKVVRLAPNPSWRSAVVSPFVEKFGLERRVRRLLRPELEPPAPLAIVPMMGVAILATVTGVVLASPSMLKTVFIAFENLVVLGR